MSAEKWTRKGTRTFQWTRTLDAYVAGTVRGSGCRTEVVGCDGAVVGGNGR